MNRRFPKKDVVKDSGSLNVMSVQTEEMSVQTEDYEIESASKQVLDNSDVSGDNKAGLDKSCQVFICEDDDSPKSLKETFVCIKYVYQDSVVDAEIQTDISGTLDIES